MPSTPSKTRRRRLISRTTLVLVLSLATITPRAEGQVITWLPRLLPLLEWGADFIVGWTVGKGLDLVIDRTLIHENERDLVRIRHEVEQYHQHVTDRSEAAKVDQVLQTVDAEIALLRMILDEKADSHQLLALARRFDAEMASLNRRLDTQERKIFDIEGRFNVLSERIQILEELLGLWTAGWYVEATALADVLQYDENDQPEAVDDSLGLGYGGWIGYEGRETDLGIGVERPKLRAMRSVATGRSIGELERQEVRAVADHAFTTFQGIHLRAVGNLFSAEVRPIDEALGPASRLHGMEGGIGIGFGGWNQAKTQGGGVTLDFLTGSSDIELTDSATGQRWLQKVDVSSRRIEAWAEFRGINPRLAITLGVYYKTRRLAWNESLFPGYDVLLFEQEWKEYGGKAGLRYTFR